MAGRKQKNRLGKSNLKDTFLSKLLPNWDQRPLQTKLFQNCSLMLTPVVTDVLNSPDCSPGIHPCETNVAHSQKVQKEATHQEERVHKTIPIIVPYYRKVNYNDINQLRTGTP